MAPVSSWNFNGIITEAASLWGDGLLRENPAVKALSDVDATLTKERLVQVLYFGGYYTLGSSSFE